jgi:hypothetical protein
VILESTDGLASSTEFLLKLLWGWTTYQNTLKFSNDYNMLPWLIIAMIAMKHPLTTGHHENDYFLYNLI